MHRCASLLLLVLLALCMAPSAAMLAGGYTAERTLSTPAPSPGGQNLDAGSHALEVALDVRAEAEAKAGHSFREWTPYSVKTQVVAGTNYQFKVKVSDTEYAFVKVFQPLPYTGKPPEARLGGVHLLWWCVCR